MSSNLNKSKASIGRLLSGEPQGSRMPSYRPTILSKGYKKHRSVEAAQRSIDSSSQAPPNVPQITIRGKKKKRSVPNPQDILSATRK